MFGLLSKKSKSCIPSSLVAKSKAANVQESTVTFTTEGTPEIVTSDASFSHLASALRYFEVVIESIHPKGCVAVGITLTSFKEKLLTGWSQSSYGYHSDDGRVFGDAVHAEGKIFHKSFGQGDVVGCGLNVRDELFFTLNGEFIKTAFSNVPKSEWYPTVGADYGARVTANFGTSPFLLTNPWDYVFGTEKTPSVCIIGQRSSFDSVPEDILCIILEYATEPMVDNHLDSLKCAKNVSNLSQVSKKCYRLLIGSQLKTTQPNMHSVNIIWKKLTLDRWVFVNESKVNNWWKLYKRRHMETKNMSSSLVVENCIEWEFKCPISIQNLQRTPNTEVDYCSKCKQNVYLSSDIEELTAHIKQGHCVIYDVGGEEYRKRNRPRMGRMIRPRTLTD